MKRLLILLYLLVSIVAQAQTFKHIGINDGLSHRHVYSIKQDNKGYVWLLTHEGVDRFNGSEYKHYNFYQQDHKLNTSIYLKSLFYTSDNILWQLGSNGQVFKYNDKSDQFDLVYNYPMEQGKVSILDFGHIDNEGHIWLGNKGNIQIYNYKNRKNIAISQHPLYVSTSIAELGDNTYAIGTYQGIYFSKIENDSLKLIQIEGDNLLKKLPTHIDFLHYHKGNNKLIIATLKDGVYTYNFSNKELSNLFKINNTSVNQITDFNDDEVLIATSGAGVYKLNLSTDDFEPYIIADYSSHEGMNGNNIKDIFIDNEGQIWMANYPVGVTVCEKEQSSYKWIKHVLNDKQSLIHDEVNYLLQDSDGDIWFATTNGISIYNIKQKRWVSLLSSYSKYSLANNYMFISICEVRPGVVWVGAYNSGIYEINKHTKTVNLINDNTNLTESSQPDRQIKAMLSDSDGNVWVGGQFNLRQIDYKTKSTRYYNDLSLITSIAEKDSTDIWIGTAKGLFLLNKQTGKFQQIQLPGTTSFINTLHQGANDNLYIGTNEGLYIFIASTGTFKHLHKENSNLITNNIRSIVSDRDNPVVYLAYEKGIAKLYLNNFEIRNWTKDQNLPTSSFSLGAAIQLKSGDFIFGSINGALLFDQEYQIPHEYNTKLVLEELIVNQNRITPSGYNNILSTSLDDTDEITLAHNENNFAIKVGSINFKYPSNISYTWILDGLYDKWSYPSSTNQFVFTNLSPGQYEFKIKAISNEDGSTLQERALIINIKQPIWWSLLAKVIYILLIGLVVYKSILYLSSRYKKQIVDSTKQFYYNTAHDIKVPLKLIKEPIEEIKEKEALSKEGYENIRVILRNLNVLLAQNDNVINYERMERDKNQLYLSEHNLNHYLTKIISLSTPIADIKKITLEYNNSITNQDLEVWFDKTKVDTIFSNLINDCINRSNDNETIHINLNLENLQWIVSVRYLGEALTEEQLQLIQHEDSINEAIYQQRSDAQKELALSLICKLVQIHKGEITIINSENEVKISISFPLYIEPINLPNNQMPKVEAPKNKELVDAEKKTILADSENFTTSKPQVLVVEDNKELLRELLNELRDSYDLSIVDSGEKALSFAKEKRPDIVISKMYLQDMKGTELSFKIKSNIETSHISVVLLTEKNDEKHIIKGLENGADEFVLKPFNYRILKASMANLLANKKRLRGQYANLEMQESIDCAHCSTNLDWTFIASVKEKVEEHMADPDFNIDKLCALLSMSRTSFYNKLKDLTEQSPSDFIRFIKLKQAANLLVNSEYSISEIADMTGFNDAKYFREVFKKHFNMTPSKYAKENK